MPSTHLWLLLPVLSPVVAASVVVLIVVPSRSSVAVLVLARAAPVMRHLRAQSKARLHRVKVNVHTQVGKTYEERKNTEYSVCHTHTHSYVYLTVCAGAHSMNWCKALLSQVG